jgi:hypothetical protein
MTAAAPLAMLRERYARLEERGAAAFDAPSMRFLGTVLGRAGALADAGRAGLLGRAEARLAALEGAFEAARAAATRVLETSATRGSIDPVLIRWHEQARFGAVALHGSRLAPRSWRPASAIPHANPREYEAAAAQARAVVTVARASDELPEAVGPYNGLVLAVRTLRQLAGLSPAVLSAHVARLADLTALASLPEAGKANKREGMDRIQPKGRRSRKQR